MRKTENAMQLIQHAGKGVSSLTRLLAPGQYRSREARQLWGFPPLLFLPIVAVVCFTVSFFIPMGIHAGNPFSMSFPAQVAQMAMGIFFSPITLFALVCGWRLKKAMKVKTVLDGQWSNIGLPILVSGSLLVALYEAYLSYGVLQDGVSVFNLVHAFGNMMFLAAWLSFFVAVSSMSADLGIGKMLGGFFSFHGILFARSFIPNFGILDFVAKALLNPDYYEANWVVVVASIVKAVLCMGVVGIFWVLMQEKLRAQLIVNQKEVLPPVPTQAEEAIPPIPNIPQTPVE